MQRSVEVAKQRRKARFAPTPKEVRDMLPKSIPQIMELKGWGVERRIEKEIELVTAQKEIVIRDKNGVPVGDPVYEPLYQVQAPALDRMHKLAADYPAEKREHSITGPIIMEWEPE